MQAEMLKLRITSVSDYDTSVQVRATFRGTCKDVQIKGVASECDEFLEWDMFGLPPYRDDTLELVLVDGSSPIPDNFLGRADVPLVNLLAESVGGLEIPLVDQAGNESGSMIIETFHLAPSRTDLSSASQLKADIGPDFAAPLISGSIHDLSKDGDFEHPQYLLPLTASQLVRQMSTMQGDGVSNHLLTNNISSQSISMDQLHSPIKVRDTLPERLTKFHIHVKVLEARQLAAATNLNPVCQVLVGGEVKCTKVQKSTREPCFEETFFFTMRQLPSQVWDTPMELRVCNSRLLRNKHTIGVVHLDLGAIYDLPNHALINKWLPLSIRGEEVSDVVGYLKTSIAVLGPNDDSPNLEKSGDVDDDVEENMQSFTRIRFRPASLNVDIHVAVDLPNVRKRKVKNRVSIDPYVVLRFAGKHVQTAVKLGENNPVFMQRLRIGFHYPPFAEHLKLVLHDWDRIGSGKVMATAAVSLSSISDSSDDGFPPTFGPSYVNLYGSLREVGTFSMPDEAKLNDGLLEGCAYRGRILVSIDTAIGEFPVVSTEELDSNESSMIQTKNYLLFCVFEGAGMIGDVSAPVEFELSMGNFGNKYEPSETLNPSVSQPLNAVYDGRKFYFIPWAKDKPCLGVQCKWENIHHRVESLNALLKMVFDIEKAIENLKTMKREDKTFEQCAHVFFDACKQLHRDCLGCLRSINTKTHSVNMLDKLIYHIRKKRISSIKKQLTELKETVNDFGKALKGLIKCQQTIRELSKEPQNSLPDIIIWMLVGQRRMAYARIPAHTVLYVDSKQHRGSNCGKVQTIELKYPGLQKKFGYIAAMLRVKLWLGLENQHEHWIDNQKDARMAYYAEVYENQVCMGGQRVTKHLPSSRPEWSDVYGMLKLPMDVIVCPVGWKFSGDWFVDPEPCLLYSASAGHMTYLEDVFENECRLPGGKWNPADVQWSNAMGEIVTPPDERKAPRGWQWDDGWQVDIHSAVDTEGWEYSITETGANFGPTKTVFHRFRRRRWIRPRKLVDEASLAKPIGDSEGWTYSGVFDNKYQPHRRPIDMIRRRRWHRELVLTIPKVPKLPILDLGVTDKKVPPHHCATMYLQHANCFKFQLRAHIYQARQLHSADKSGLSDPFICIIFINQCEYTKRLNATLCPTWNTTIVFDDVTIYGHPGDIIKNPPCVAIEVFDHDAFSKAELLGRALITPEGNLDPENPKQPVLQWHPLFFGELQQGELLGAFELYCKGGKLPHHTGIRPVLQRSAIEIVCWGVRKMKKIRLMRVQRPFVEFECAGSVIFTEEIKSIKRHPNFKNPFLFMEVMLPIEPQYMPPLVIKVRDHLYCGTRVMIGAHVIKTIQEYRVDPGDSGSSEKLVAQRKRTALGKANASDKRPPKAETEDDQNKSKDLDWWSKYYASASKSNDNDAYLEKGFEKLTIYHTELEKLPCFNKLQGVLTSFLLQRGKTTEIDDSSAVGELKAAICVYALPEDPSDTMPPKQIRGVPPLGTEELVVRIYIIRCRDLSAKDADRASDPFLVVKVGDTRQDTRDDYKAKTLNPIFGTLMEFPCVLPKDNELVVSVMDYDKLSKDDLIGETHIDLENRCLSKFRATCGIPLKYHLFGPNRWRDFRTPRQILEDICKTDGLDPPLWMSEREVVIGDKNYVLSELDDGFEIQPPTLGPDDERLALIVLHTLGIVPEHVETRQLFNPAMPGIEQGRIEMFVDIFRQTEGIPDFVFDISPRTPVKFELRVVVFNVFDVLMQEYSAMAGSSMSDVYVKCWLQGTKSVQKTDVHYRCMDGEAMFNWMFIFELDYLEAERMMVIKGKKHIWSTVEREERRPPNLMFQVWDDDIISKDDFLGEAELNLSRMISPARVVEECGLHQLPLIGHGSSHTIAPRAGSNESNKSTDHEKYVDLWQRRRARGFWPVVGTEDNKMILAGKLDLELEVLTQAEAELHPARKLDPPDRPATSFLWFMNPWKTLKFVIWKRFKLYIVSLIIIVPLVAFGVLFVYEFPGAFAHRFVNIF